MSEHVDALGYLLAAVVFSVGFLSARIHANLDSTVRAVGERSWRVRQAILDGSRLGPADLADVLGVVRRTRDYVAIGSRILNWTLFLTTCVVLGDALALAKDGVAAPNHQKLVIVLLFAASLAVVVFAEFDVRRVSVEQRQEIAASTLGRLQNLAHLIEAHDTRRASREVTHLRETFPTWGLLVELQAYLELLDGRASEGLHRIEALVEAGADLYLSPVVGTACLLELSNPDGAGDLLARMQREGEHMRHLAQLRRALAVSAGHLPALLAPVQHGEPVSQPTHSTAQRLIGQEIERRHASTQELALDLEPNTVAQTRPLMLALGLWEKDGEPSSFADVEALSLLINVILGSESNSKNIKSLNVFAANCHDPGTLQSLGLVCLALGEPRDALKHLESSIRLAPASVRSHWGRAIACHRVGWSDAARASLRRVETLSEDGPLLALTQGLLEGKELGVDAAQIDSSYLQGPTEMARFELALLGAQTSRPDGSDIRSRFASTLIARASEGPTG